MVLRKKSCVFSLFFRPFSHTVFRILFSKGGNSVPTVYLDLLLCLNGFVDYLLLSAVAALRHLPHTRWRQLFGSLVGAVSSLIILLPALPTFWLLLYDVLTAAGMIFCAFPFCRWTHFSKSVGLLFLLSAGFSGLSYLLWFFVAPTGFFVFNGAVYYNVSPVALVLCSLVCYGVFRLYERLSSKAVKPTRLLTLIAENRGQTVVFRAFHDTGFSLCDSFSGRPVILVDKAVATPLLPTDETAFPEKFRLVPYHTVAGDGLLYAFCPARLSLLTNRGETPISGAFLALSDTLKGESFDALCGDEIAKFCT